jgi:gliding motility-associated-like protein
VVPPVTGTFRWQTTCEHISNQPYSVVFKAVDSLNKTTPKLADLKTVNIKVVGPAPEDVQATAQLGEVDITWLKPYICEDAAEDYFYGFSVWRREGSNDFPIDTCDPGLEGKGYQELIFVTKQEKDGRYHFKDTQVERGRTYCYRILAKFARISAGGYPYNLVEGLASKEVCVQLPRDLPLMTHVSVLETSTTTGRMDVRWAKPLSNDLDTVLNPGPYRYQVQRAPGFTGGTFTDLPGANFISNQLWQSDTVFEDTDLNTQDGPYRYRIAFYVNNQTEPLGTINDASSVFLTVASTDNTNNLSWTESVPWENYLYRIFRRSTPGGPFEPIGTSTTAKYADTGLENGKEYCYFVQSEGTYSINGITNPLINNSQEACGIPRDTVPPCAPQLSVGNLCNDQGGPAPDPPYENNLSWTNPNLTCPGTDDALRYNLWFSPDEDMPLELLTGVDGSNNLTFVHVLEDGLAGCYQVTALDSLGNESLRSNKVCVDNCPNYELPNVFTPNGDGFNEVFTPFPGWRFIDRIDMQIFNRWGNLVFSTTNPAINWNGKNLNGDDVAEGSYFYVCRVYEKRVDGVVLRDGELSGFIEVVRGER